jgi:HSP20 family protein
MKSHTALSPLQEELNVKPFSTTSFWDDVNRLTKQIEKRAYELFEWRGRQDGFDREDWINAEREFLRPIPIEITEKAKILQIRAEIPGFSAEELEINLEAQNLTIKGSHDQAAESKEENTYCSEFGQRQVFRSIPLPLSVIPERATARLKDGVLEIQAEKASAAKPIAINAAA